MSYGVLWTFIVLLHPNLIDRYDAYEAVGLLANNFPVLAERNFRLKIWT